MHSALGLYIMSYQRSAAVHFSFQFRNHPAVHFFSSVTGKEVFIQTLTPALHPEVRSSVGIPALPLASCVSSGSYNKTPQGGWLINGRNQCLPVLKPGNPRSSASMVFPCLTAGTFLYALTWWKGLGALDSHLLRH